MHAYIDKYIQLHNENQSKTLNSRSEQLINLIVIIKKSLLLLWARNRASNKTKNKLITNKNKNENKQNQMNKNKTQTQPNKQNM